MLKFSIPFRENYDIEELVFDYNGTLATDGKMAEAVYRRLVALARELRVTVITADTYGTVKKELENTGIEVRIISRERGTLEKKEYVESLGRQKVIAFGNGANDALMLEAAAIGVVVMNPEGVSLEAMAKGDLMVASITDALDLIDRPGRLVAGLRR
ncbi:MAG: hypothetical protein AVO33_01840 [delta proteobacterium ML8_F1]|nr:MAG: hypothetical protein AVO33_01840 [delta proteobacterium ML8_F1]